MPGSIFYIPPHGAGRGRNKIKDLRMECKCLRANIDTEDDTRICERLNYERLNFENTKYTYNTQDNKNIMMQQFDKIIDKRLNSYPAHELENKLKECKDLLIKNNINIQCKCAEKYKIQEKRDEKIMKFSISILFLEIVAILGLMGHYIYYEIKKYNKD